MNKSKSLGQSAVPTSEMKVAHFKLCPCCKSEDLVKFEVDYFCMDCDWNSILFDVYSGNFEKRIGIMNRAHAKKNQLNLQGEIIHLNDLVSFNSDVSANVDGSKNIISTNNYFSKVGRAK